MEPEGSSEESVSIASRHSVTSQEIFILIKTTVRTSNLSQNFKPEVTNSTLLTLYACCVRHRSLSLATCGDRSRWTHQFNLGL